MKFLLLLFYGFLLNTDTGGWLTNFEEAQKIAAEKNKYILLNFSGSDWCGKCMMMRKEIFESPVFKDYSAGHLVLLNADFPRNKKNRLSKEQVKQNETMAEKYDPEGKFPYTVLLNAQGKIIKAWDGFSNKTADEFINETRVICETGK